MIEFHLLHRIQYTSTSFPVNHLCVGVQFQPHPGKAGINNENLLRKKKRSYYRIQIQWMTTAAKIRYHDIWKMGFWCSENLKNYNFKRVCSSAKLALYFFLFPIPDNKNPDMMVVFECRWSWVPPCTLGPNRKKIGNVYFPVFDLDHTCISKVTLQCEP